MLLLLHSSASTSAGEQQQLATRNRNWQQQFLPGCAPAADKAPDQGQCHPAALSAEQTGSTTGSTVSALQMSALQMSAL
jgi:hypothetical protein